MFDIADYQEAHSVSEALAMLAADDKAKIIAGGTDVLIALRRGDLSQARLIGIRHIEKLRDITVTEQGQIVIGAAVTFSQLMAHSLIRSQIPVLAEAASEVGGPQTRRVATLGGNICNGSTSADGAPPLFALDAVLQIESLGGVRMVPITEFYRSSGKVNLQQGELLTAITIAKDHYEGLGAHYIKYAMRKAMDIATLSCAAACKIGAGGELRDVRLAFGVAAPVPLRCLKAESLAEGQVFSADLAAEFAETVLSEINPRTSWRATKEFRLHLAKQMSTEALARAYVKAGGKLP